MADEIDILAGATCHYLEYKRLSGLQSLLGESILTFAVAEYLVVRGWAISSERNLQNLEAISSPDGVGYLSCDLDASRGDERIAFELKYLKSSAKSSPQSTHSSVTSIERIKDDVIKLSYVDSQKWRSILVLAHQKNVSSHHWLPENNSKRRLLFRRRNSDDVGADIVYPSERLDNRIGKEFHGRLPSDRFLWSLTSISHGEMCVSIFEIRV